MKVHRPLLILALAAPMLAAQEPGPAFDLKIHGGLTGGDLHQDHLANQILGFGFCARLPLGGTSGLLLELGYDYLPGRDHDAMPSSGPVYYNYQTPVTSFEGQNLYLAPGNSIDWRKETTQGFSLRGAYTDQLGRTGWYWFAGVTLDFYKTQAQFAGTLIPMYDGEGGATAVPGYELVDPQDPSQGYKDYYEGFALTREKTKLQVGFQAGLGLPLNKNFKLEFTLRDLGYTHLDYRPFTYTGRPAAMAETSRRGFTFEVGLALKI